MTSRDEARVACTLGGKDYHERLAWIAQLNRDGLRSHRRDAMALELHYTSAVRDRVYQLVRQEAECCAFLAFAVNESDDQVCVTISVPERTAEIADDLLAPFLPPGDVDQRRTELAGVAEASERARPRDLCRGDPASK